MPRKASRQVQSRMVVDGAKYVMNGRIPATSNGRIESPPSLLHCF